MKTPLIFFDLGGVLLLEADKSIKRDPQYNHINIFLRTFEFVDLFYKTDSKEQWYLGKIDSTEIVKTITDNIDKPEYENFFQDATERDLIKHGCSAFLVPQTLVANTHIIPESS